MSTCLICKDEVENGFTITHCGCNVIYHSKCYEKWINNNRSCPTCRHIYNKKPCKENEYQESENSVNIFSLQYNILRIMSGLGGLSFYN